MRKGCKIKGRNDRIQGEKGIKFLMRLHLAGLGRTSANFYNYSERGSSLCCCVYELIEKRLNKIGRLLLYLLETDLRDHK